MFTKIARSAIKVDDKKVVPPTRAAMKYSMNLLLLILNILQMVFQ